MSRLVGPIVNVLTPKGNVKTLKPVSSFNQNPWNYNSPKIFNFARINGHKCRNRNSSLDLIKLWNILGFKEHNQRKIKTFKKNDQKLSMESQKSSLEI